MGWGGGRGVRALTDECVCEALTSQSNLEQQVDYFELDSEISLIHLATEQFYLPKDKKQLQLTRLAQMLLYFRQ